MQVLANPRNYDAWFDLIGVYESQLDNTNSNNNDTTVDTTAQTNAVRDVYERAIANIPLSNDKSYWRRYIYLWIYYAVFEELVAKVWLVLRCHIIFFAFSCVRFR
jgi:crooked neck